MADRTFAHARRMRGTPTYNEERLWRLLRDRRLDHLKFRRQVPLGRYIVDFLCLRHRLVVEADGPFHDPERDAIRDRWLSEQKFRVLRFSNSAISNDADKVLARILKAVSRPVTDDYDRPQDRWRIYDGAPLPPAYMDAEPPRGG